MSNLENPFTPKSALPKKRLFGGEEKQSKRKKEMAEKIKHKVEMAQREQVFSAEIYQAKINSLKETGVIKQLENGQWGIVDIKGKERPVPSYEEVKARLETKSELLAKKIEQGFTELLLVPIGAPLSFLIGRARDLIVIKHKEGKLLGTDNKKLELDEKEPVYVAYIYYDADVKGDLVYYPQEFDKYKHRGKTKEELIKETGGWQIELIEALPDLPAKNNGKTIKGRKQFEEDQSPEQYLDKIQTDTQYANEQFTTPEAQLIYFMEYLQRNNQVIDDPQGNGKCCWNVGAYFKGNDAVPSGDWSRHEQRFSLRWGNPATQCGGNAARASVKF